MRKANGPTTESTDATTAATPATPARLPEATIAQRVRMKNVFQIHEQGQSLPFAASRHNWGDNDLIVVTKVEPRGKYGKAYGFSVRDGKPNDHLAYSSWKKDMELPNVGSYQWRPVEVPQFRLEELVDEFYGGVGKRYGFEPPVDRKDEWIAGMLGNHEDS